MDYRLNKIINIIRNLNEEMMAAGNAGFSSASPAEGPTAGFDPLVGKKKKRKPTPLGRYRTRVNWRQKDGE